MSAPTNGSVRWYRSFYWRIGLSFVILVIVVLVAQSAIFGYILARSNLPFRGRSPNNLAAIVAADIGSTLSQQPALDLNDYLNREYSRTQPIYVVMKGGGVAANRSSPLAGDLRSSVEAVLAGVNFKRTGSEPQLGGPPVVMAPVQVSGELRGMVVLPPAPPPSPIARDVGRMLSLPGPALLILATAVAALFIFRPAKSRLEELEQATERLGAGDLTARAPERGADEIAHVALGFNRMAGELARRDEALRTSDRLRRQMLADVSHELKTPLTAMRGYVETLRMTDITLDGVTRKRCLDTLERETLRLDRIVKDLLDLARLENGVGSLDVRVFATSRVFEHVVDRHEQEAKARDIQLMTRVTPGADQMVGDPDRIEQVIENLVANALRHTPDGGTIEVGAEVVDDSIRLSVVDSGEGIPPEHVPHVFDRFYKVDQARANGATGSGLGLSIARAIVERHTGTIGVISAPGRTAFTIELPQDSSGTERREG
ncbi:MAG: HAMP domain-containing sensor histidine kinase [Vicinamibacterales bacterium]